MSVPSLHMRKLRLGEVRDLLTGNDNTYPFFDLGPHIYEVIFTFLTLISSE